jgi:hypothetical protein
LIPVLLFEVGELLAVTLPGLLELGDADILLGCRAVTLLIRLLPLLVLGLVRPARCSLLL